MQLLQLFSAIAIIGFIGVAHHSQNKWTPYPDLVTMAVVSCLVWTYIVLPERLKHIPMIGVLIMLVNNQNSPGPTQLPFLGFGAGVLITIIAYMTALRK